MMRIAPTQNPPRRHGVVGKRETAPAGLILLEVAQIIMGTAEDLFMEHVIMTVVQAAIINTVLR